MSTTVNRKKSVIAARGASAAAATTRRSRQMLIVLALALGAIPLALSAPVVHAAPEDGTGSEPVDGTSSQLPNKQPQQVYASENPVVCKIGQDWKPIAVTWAPVVWAHWTVTENGKVVYQGITSSFDLQVWCGHTYTVQVGLSGWIGDEGTPSAPPLTITTKSDDSLQPQQPLPLPQLPEVNSPLIPKLPGLALGGTRG